MLFHLPLRHEINLGGVLFFTVLVCIPTAELDIQRRTQLRDTISLNLVNPSSDHFMCSLLNQFFLKKARPHLKPFFLNL